MKWFWSLLFISQFAWADLYIKTDKENCSPLDLRNEKLQEVRNQKKLSWCYAFTAADMLTYTFDLKEDASAADVAINYNDSDIGQFMRWLSETFGRSSSQGELETFMMPHQTGFNKVALSRAMRDGYCPERIFPSESWTKMTRSGDQWTESQIDLKSAMLDIYSLLKKQQTLNLENLPFYFHFKNVESPEAFFDLIKGQKLSTFYSKLRKEVCKFDRIKFQHRYDVMMYLKDQFTFFVVNKQLNQGQMVGIDYDSRILTDNRNISIELSELHTSSLVGRRWNQNSGQCQYLIRDSHGNQCSRYDASYECLGGQVWMDESKLYANLLSLVYTIKQ